MLERLKKSRFRSSFHLSEKDKAYVKEKGISEIGKQALDFLNKRIKIRGKNDGKQTPYKGQPIFVAQHATATCCRKCIEKWHGFYRNKELSDKEVLYLRDLVLKWIALEIRNTYKEISFN